MRQTATAAAAAAQWEKRAGEARVKRDEMQESSRVMACCVSDVQNRVAQLTEQAEMLNSEGRVDAASEVLEAAGQWRAKAEVCCPLCVIHG